MNIKIQYRRAFLFLKNIFNPDKAHCVPRSVYHNRLLHFNIIPLQLLGYIIFTNDPLAFLHNIRGIFVFISFLVFNITQVSDINFDKMFNIKKKC